MARILCLMCRYAVPQLARVASELTAYLHCLHGVPGAGSRTACAVFMREPGADDDGSARDRLPGRWPIVGTAT